VPFIARWSGRVKTGQSDALISQVDLPASFAALIGEKLAVDDAPDSFDILSALLGKSPAGRDHLVEHARVLSLIKGNWKYIEPGKGPKINKNTNTELGLDPRPQLYNLKNDLGEKHNVASEHPGIVKKLAALLKKIKDDGHTRPYR
jgi:arylsulfatase A-like enzyme